jgi:hypothetical protein
MNDLATLDAGFDVTPNRDAGLFVSFYYYTDKDETASKLEGRPVYKDYEYLRAVVAGTRDVIERPATAQDKRRYYKQYEQFKRREEQKPTGFPLAEWPGISRSQVEELKFFNIFTVEQLASVTDAHGQKFVAFQALKQKAQAYLDSLKERAPFERVRAELAERDAQIRELQETVALLKSKLEEDDE